MPVTDGAALPQPVERTLNEAPFSTAPTARLSVAAASAVCGGSRLQGHGPTVSGL